MKILIAGGPKVGKTTLAHALSSIHLGILHGDDLIGKLDWSEASEEISRWIDYPGQWIIEGVQVGRALRKWLNRNPEGKPADIIYYSFDPWITLTNGQSTMNKGCKTVWDEVHNELLRRGVTVEEIKHHESGLCIAGH
jgi:adenylate kinase family enzyme